MSKGNIIDVKKYGKLIKMSIEQKLASNPKISAWVSSSAGSGKTKTLTDRVLRLLLEDMSPKKILCITFTKAACGEMQERIINELYSWSTISDEELRAKLAKLCDKEIADEFLMKSKILLLSMLDNNESVTIETIHGFCQKLLKKFPLEIGISPDFSIMDEHDAKDMLKLARIKLFNNLSNHKNLSNAIENIAWRLNEGRFTDLINDVIKQRGKLLKLFGNYDHAQFYQLLCQKFNIDINISEEEILHHNCQDSIVPIEPLKRAVEIIISKGTKTDIERATNISNWLNMDLKLRIANFELYSKSYINKDGTLSKTLLTGKLKTAHMDIYQLLLDEQARVTSLLNDCKSSIIAKASSDLLLIVREIFNQYSKDKYKEAKLDYNDLTYLTLKLLNNSDMSGWVLYKLDGNIEHLMIDEAQDTSPEQWDIIMALCQDFFAGESTNEHKTLFIVGDEKQSIYRFQGADPDCFVDIKSKVKTSFLAANKDWRDIFLQTSYRSTDAVLKLVDKIFADNFMAKSISKIEGVITHQLFRANAMGKAEIWPLVIKEQEEDSIQNWQLPIEQSNKQDTYQALAEKITDQIAKWLGEGRILQAKNRKVQPGDILILVRRRNILVDYLQKSLKRKGIPVSGADRLVLNDHLAIKDLIGFAEFTLLPDDDLNFANILKSPLINLSEEDLFNIAYDRGDKSLWENFCLLAKDNKHYQKKYRWLHNLLRKAKRIRPFEFFHYLLFAKKGKIKFLQRLGNEAADPIEELLSCALDFEADLEISLQIFVAWFKSGDTVIKRDQDLAGDVVRIMTIHGAKGLQAPIVILPDTMQIPVNQDNILWSNDKIALPIWNIRSALENDFCKNLKLTLRQKDYEEYLRLFYVALTRAEDEIYICGAINTKEATERSWYSIASGALKIIGKLEDQNYVFKTDGFIEEYRGYIDNERNILPAFDLSFIVEYKNKLINEAKFISPSLLTPPKNIKVNDDEARQEYLAREKGVAIHKILEYAKGNNLSNLVANIDGILFKLLPNIDKNVLLDLKNNILQIFSLEEFKFLFTDNAQTEVPIIGKISKNIISGCIDRLVFEKDVIYLIDYKSDVNCPINQTLVPRKYLGQLQLYKQLLQKIYPQMKIILYILWTHRPYLMYISDELILEK